MVEVILCVEDGCMPFVEVCSKSIAKLLRRTRLLSQTEKVTEELNSRRCALEGVEVVLIVGMACDAKFALIVHLLRANLDLHGLFRYPRQRIDDSMNGPIPVLLWSTDIVLQLPGNRMEYAVHDT